MSKEKTKKRPHWIWKRLLGITAAYVLVLRFVLGPRSESNWITYFLVHEGFLHLLAFCVLMAILSLRHLKLTLGWIGLFVAVGLLLGAPSFGSRPVDNAGKKLRVLTYNVAHFSLNRPEVEKILRDSNADIIFLQEVSRGDQLATSGDDLCLKMPGYKWVGASSNMIVSRHPIKLERVLNVPTKWPTKEFPVAMIDSPLGKLRVMCVHMEPSWVLGGSLDTKEIVPVLSKVAADRRAQIDLVLAALKPSREPVILAGDFNGPPSSESIMRIANVFTDCFATTEKGFGMSLLASLPYKRIDYVFERGLTPQSSEVIESRASDHKPILTVLGQ